MTERSVGASFGKKRDKVGKNASAVGHDAEDIVQGVEDVQGRRCWKGTFRLRLGL